MSLAPGTRLGPYEIVAPLGVGGMGEVYRGRAGVLAVNPVQLTPDGRGYVYGYRRVLSDLYVVAGIR